LHAYLQKVKRITRRSSPVNLRRVLQELNPVLRGFANYFRMANCRGEFDLSTVETGVLPQVT
jgi:hypothetical protein